MVPPTIHAVPPADVTIDGLLTTAIKLEMGRRDQAASTRIGTILHAAGWEKGAKRIGGKHTRYYTPPAEESDPQ
jgi:hypothetical protein